MMSEMITDLGAEPVQVVYSQVYAALRNGQIDGAENNWPSYDAMGHYEVAPYFLQDEHTRVPEIQLASTAAIEKLEALDPLLPGGAAHLRAGVRPHRAAALGRAGGPQRKGTAGVGRGSDHPARRRKAEIPRRRPASL